MVVIDANVASHGSELLVSTARREMLVAGGSGAGLVVGMDVWAATGAGFLAVCFTVDGADGLVWLAALVCGPDVTGWFVVAAAGLAEYCGAAYMATTIVCGPLL